MTPSNIHRKPKSVLLSHEREKKKKYLQGCLDQRRNFSLLVVSFDGVLRNEAKVAIQTLYEASPRNQESPIPNFKLHERALQLYEPQI